MFNPSKFRIFTILSVCIAGILFSIANVLPKEMFDKLPAFMQQTINLGLDLKGGSYILLEIDEDAFADEVLNNFIQEVRSNLRKSSIGYTDLKRDKDNNKSLISINIRKIEQTNEALNILSAIDKTFIVQNLGNGRLEIVVNKETQEQKFKGIIEQSIEIVRKRVDETGTKEPTILKQGNNRICLQLPGIQDPKEIKKLLGKTAKLTLHLVDDQAQITGFKSSDSIELPYEDGRDHGKISVKKTISISGENLIDAQASTSENGEPAVSIEFNTIGTKKFAQISRENINKRSAFVMDGKVISAPVFKQEIPNGKASISGGFSSIKEANELALILRAGSLPAPLKVVEERVIGPSLGADSVSSGKNATIIAFILVSAFMFIGYRVFGFFANIALTFNLILLFAGLSLLGATLTLPGIAGIAMTIGVAVDANVLIYERIKEELRHGATAFAAIEAGYSKAMATIVDANLTTLIAAAALYEFGSGPIRGFAVTTALGIVVSMFTALSVTKLLTAWWFKNKSHLTQLPI